ncbi:MAG TPA: MBL fold metallo-hydrolase [Vicinamibacterales bacterium]|nr:MBL fold metallo-hydrolase [Vicinamibacterales bacterium]
MKRRDLLTGTLGLAALGAVGRLAPSFVALHAQAGTGVTGTVAPADDEKGTRLVLLGTQGGPNVNLRRAQASNALVVDGRVYLVDCGYGAVRGLVAAGLRYGQVGTVFLTHLHDDHTADLPAFISLQWTGSRTQPTDIYGPFGTSAMVDAALAFAKANTEIRVVDEGRTVRPEMLFHGHDLAATDTPAEAFKDDRLTVRSIENTHFPDRSKANMRYRSIGYRFDAGGRSIVITGDTAYSKNLVTLAEGADLFVCEIMDETIYKATVARAEAAAKAGNPNNIFRHVAETHSTPEIVGRMASEAKVKTVVLTHLLPGSNRAQTAEFPDSTYIDAVHRYFPGEVIVGRDQMVL